MNSKKIICWVISVTSLIVVFSLGIWIGVTKVAYHVDQPENIDFSLFWDTYNTLQEKFIGPEKITDQNIVYGAIKGMAESLDDPYTNFYNPEEAQRFQEDLAGSFEGIGVEIGIKNDLLTVIAPLKDTPGERAGLKSGDIIVEIDGKDSTKMSTEEAVSLIRGTRGTPVTLTILRDGWETAEDIKIVRDVIKVISIEWSLKNEDTAYIQIYQFNEALATDFETIAYEILQSHATKIVLDLRDNPGGYLEVAQNIAGWFLKSDEVVTIEDFGEGKTQEVYKTSGNANFANYPTVVLINEGSASASEILAGALRDNRNIELIGKKSFGKGCVQEVITLHGGSFLKVTVANWLTPNGSSISDVGLTPDVEVEITDADYDAKIDPQLNKALEIIKTLQ